MKIDCIEMHHLELPFVHPFETSFGRETKREFILLSVTADGVTDFLLEDLLRYEKTLDKIRDYGTI